MPSRMIHGLIISMTMFALIFATVSVSYAETTNYIYDELNRLIRVEYEDGSYIEYIYDKAGNRRYLGPEDLTPPVTTALPAGGIYNTPQSITLTCNDGVGSGCDKIYYTTDGNPPTTSSPIYSSPINISTVGTTTLQFFGIDFAGNSETVKTETYTIDTTPPTTTASPIGGGYSTPQSVTLTCSDGSGTGCNKIYYTTDGTTPTTSSQVYSLPINISVTTTLKFFATDNAGNSEEVKTEFYAIQAAPIGTILINFGAESTNSRDVALTLTCSDDHGCSKMKFSNNGTTYSTAEAFAPTKDWTLSSGNGTKSVHAKFKDAVGNWSTALTDTILFDNVAPTTTAGGIVNGGISAVLSCYDGAGSGCDKIYYTTDGTTPTTSSPVYSSPINIVQTTTLKFFARDLAGNRETVKTQIYTIN